MTLAAWATSGVNLTPDAHRRGSRARRRRRGARRLGEAGVLLAGSAVFVVGSVLDILGAWLGRAAGNTVPGAFLDSTVDRLGEGIMLRAIALVLMRDGNEWGVAVTFAAVVGSFLVSYT